MEILEKAQKAIYDGIDPNGQDEKGNTPMHYCAKNWYRHVVRMLASSGAHKSIYIVNGDGQLPEDMVGLD